MKRKTKTNGYYLLYVTDRERPPRKRLDGRTLKYRLDELRQWVQMNHFPGRVPNGRPCTVPIEEYEVRPFKDGYAIYCRGMRVVSTNPHRPHNIYGLPERPWESIWELDMDRMHEQYDYNE